MRLLVETSFFLVFFWVKVHAFVPTFQQSAAARKILPRLASYSGEDVLTTLESAVVVDPTKGRQCKALEGLSLSSIIRNTNSNTLEGILANVFNNKPNKSRKTMVVVMPQLGDFDSAEYAELLVAVLPDLKKANVELRVIGIGDETAARKFASFAGLPLQSLRVDPEGRLHRALKLHGGPDWDIPSFVPDSVLQWFADYTGADETTTQEDRNLVARAWLNYMAMCAGIAAPDTLPEILRGYFGDKSAPERLRPDETVTVGDDLIAVTGVTDVKLGPIEYQSLWKNEKGYQRPAELATVRLRVMVEVLTNLKTYVPDQKHLHLRGATFIFDPEGNLEYEHRDTGVLAYSKTMPRPLTFLQPYIGPKALNPLELGDNKQRELASSADL